MKIEVEDYYVKAHGTRVYDMKKVKTLADFQDFVALVSEDINNLPGELEIQLENMSFDFKQKKLLVAFEEDSESYTEKRIISGD